MTTNTGLVVATLRAGAETRRRAATAAAAVVTESARNGRDPRSASVKIVRELGDAATLDGLADDLETGKLTITPATRPADTAAGADPVDVDDTDDVDDDQLARDLLADVDDDDQLADVDLDAVDEHPPTADTVDA